MFDSREVLELCRKAAGADVYLASTDELMEAAVALEHARGLLETTSAHLLARMEAEGVTDLEVGMPTGAWLAREAVVPRPRCRSRVRSAERLIRFFGLFDTAAGEGRIGWAHVELICSVANGRNAAALAEVQEHLIAIACQFSFEHWAALVRQLAEELDEDGGYDPNEDVHANRMRLSPQPDRTVEMRGRLVGRAGTTVSQTLDTIADELFRQFQRDVEVDPSIELPSRNTLLALALQEVCRRALAVDLDSSAQPGVEAVLVIEQGADGSELRSRCGTLQPDSAASLLVDAAVRALLAGATHTISRPGAMAASPTSRPWRCCVAIITS